MKKQNHILLALLSFVLLSACSFDFKANMGNYEFDKDTDTDGDGIPDLKELSMGLDPDKTDSDGDGLGDAGEDTELGQGGERTDAPAEVLEQQDGRA